MKNIFSILITLIISSTINAQSNLDFERWVTNFNGIDEAKGWLNTSDASKFNAPQVLFHETDDPAKGDASIRLTTAYWEVGTSFGLDTLVGAIVQQEFYTQCPKSFEFLYKAFLKQEMLY